MKSAGNLVHVLQTIKAQQDMRVTRNMKLSAVSLLGLTSLTVWTPMVMGGMVATLRLEIILQSIARTSNTEVARSNKLNTQSSNLSKIQSFKKVA